MIYYLFYEFWYKISSNNAKYKLYAALCATQNTIRSLSDSYYVSHTTRDRDYVIFRQRLLHNVRQYGDILPSIMFSRSTAYYFFKRSC